MDPNPDLDHDLKPIPMASGEAGDGADHPHNFAVQKLVHQKIRNDPDYDDWEYGTEPLPQEAWSAKQQRQAS